MTKEEIIKKIADVDATLLSVANELRNIKDHILDLDESLVKGNGTMPSISEPLGYTLEDLYNALGKKKNRSYARRLRTSLNRRNIKTLEEFLSLTPGEVLGLEQVGYETLLHTKKAIERLGLVW